jgi:hypothetical protein
VACVSFRDLARESRAVIKPIRKPLLGWCLGFVHKSTIKVPTRRTRVTRWNAHGIPSTFTMLSRPHNALLYRSDVSLCLSDGMQLL